MGLNLIRRKSEFVSQKDFEFESNSNTMSICEKYYWKQFSRILLLQMYSLPAGL